MDCQNLFFYFQSPEKKCYLLLENHTMPKYSIVFILPVEKKQLKHRIIESNDMESALKIFFAEEIIDFYTSDEQGFFYFKQDFYDSSNPSGSIISFE